MKVMTTCRTALAVCGAAFLLAACGGGGGSGGAATDPLVAGTEVPISATTSAAGASNFVRSVVNSAADDKESLIVGNVVLATTETEEPEAI